MPHKQGNALTMEFIKYILGSLKTKLNGDTLKIHTYTYSVGVSIFKPGMRLVS